MENNKKKKTFRRALKRLNITTVFFFVLSIISTTFAWFAYTNVLQGNLEVEIAAWNIVLLDNNSTINRTINIALDDFYPGIDTYTKRIDITNNGDIPAKVDYNITYFKILDNEYSIEDQEDIKEPLAHDNPFYINMGLESSYLAPQSTSAFDIVIGWPLDSGDDELDSEWGQNTYTFRQTNHDEKCIVLSIEIKINQYVEGEDIVSDNNYRYGVEDTIGSRTAYVFSKDVKKTDSQYTVVAISNATHPFPTSPQSDALLSAASGTYIPSVNQFIDLISIDIYSSFINVDGLSPRIIGIIYNDSNITDVINKLKENDHNYISFNASKFSFLSSNTCYWTSTSYNSTKGFAIRKIGTELNIYPENKTTACYYAVALDKTKS